jgi:prepilin-type N-terminal cleavage/methylation domain-containing protein
MHDLRRRAFTLVELLVVIAVIALLVSLLLPSLRGARDVARALVCASNARTLAQGQTMYSNEWKDYFATEITSGAETALQGGANAVFDTTPSTPTSPNDWISPTMGESLGFSANRAQRLQQIFSRVACPAAIAKPNIPYTLAGSYADKADVDNLNMTTDGFRQTSYLVPETFHYMPTRAVAEANTYRGFVLYYGHDQPALVPAMYRPRTDLLGVQPSQKVVLADGTRYLDDVAAGLDFDPRPSQQQFGAFVDGGPIFNGSTPYGRAFHTAPSNIKLSFRHPGDTFDVGYWDGHVSRMKSLDAWKNPYPWYPGGSIFNGTDGTPESVAFLNTIAKRKIP